MVRGMSIDWNIIAASMGFAGARAALFEYQSWKARRTEIPLDLNPRTGVYEPDLKLKRLERYGAIAAWAAWGGFAAIGTLMIMSY